MNATRMIETKDQILQQFVRLQEEYEALASRIETKEEEAVRREDREVVAAANEHTVENIVTGLANLQLSFSTVIQDTSTQLSTEASRLEQLRRAIQVETTRLDQLKNVQIAADALDILKQEQAETTRAFDADSAQRLADLDQTVSEARVGWEKEQAGFVQSVADFDAALQRKRELEEADYSYTLARKLEQEADAFARRQRTVARNHELLQLVPHTQAGLGCAELNSAPVAPPTAGKAVKFTLFRRSDNSTSFNFLTSSLSCSLRSEVPMTIGPAASPGAEIGPA